LDAVVADTALVSALGPAFVEQFLLVKRAEWDAFHLQVSTWEMERYAAFY
jgi:glutamine synthetase